MIDPTDTNLKTLNKTLLKSLTSITPMLFSASQVDDWINSRKDQLKLSVKSLMKIVLIMVVVGFFLTFVLSMTLRIDYWLMFIMIFPMYIAFIIFFSIKDLREIASIRKELKRGYTFAEIKCNCTTRIKILKKDEEKYKNIEGRRIESKCGKCGNNLLISRVWKKK